MIDYATQLAFGEKSLSDPTRFDFIAHPIRRFVSASGTRSCHTLNMRMRSRVRPSVWRSE